MLGLGSQMSQKTDGDGLGKMKPENHILEKVVWDGRKMGQELCQLSTIITFSYPVLIRYPAMLKRRFYIFLNLGIS